MKIVTSLKCFKAEPNLVLAEGKAYIIGSTALIVEFKGHVQFIGWIMPSCIYTDIVLNGIINKLQYSLFYIKRAMNRVPACVITLILG